MFTYLTALSLSSVVSTGPDMRTVESITTPSGKFVRIEGRANTFLAGQQHQASLARALDGTLAVTWVSNRQSKGGEGALIRHFDRLGTPAKDEAFVTKETRYPQLRPSVAFSRNGEVHVSFESLGRDDQPVGVYLDDQPANEKRLGSKRDSVVGVTASGAPVIAYTAETAHNSPKVYVKIGDSKPVRVSQAPSGRETVPTMVVTETGLAIAWQQQDAKGRYKGISVRMLDLAGRPKGETALMAGSGALAPSLSVCGEGLLLGWLQPVGAGYRAQACRLDSRLSVQGGVISVTGQQGDQTGVAVAGRKDGSFAIAWNRETGQDTDVFIQTFGASSKADGPAWRATSLSDGKQSLATSSGSTRLVYAENEIVLAWNGNAGLGDRSSVNFTRLIDPSALSAGDLNAVQVASEASRAGLKVKNGSSESEMKFVKVVSEPAGPHQPPVQTPLRFQNPWGVVFPGAAGGFNAFTPTTFTPPDCDVAIGIDHVVATVNDGIAFFNKDGTKTYSANMRFSNGFWGNILPGDFVFDPETIYDETTNRFWVMAAIANAPGSKSYMLIAVTATGDPNGTWHKYIFDTSSLAGNTFDSPNFGVDENVLYVTGDGFGIGANYPVYTFDKAPFLSGNPPTIQKSTTLSTSTQSAGLPDVQTGNGGVAYLLEHKESATNTTVSLIALTNPLTTPSFQRTNVTVPTYSNPTDPQQQGSATRPESFDSRMWNVKFRNGRFWASQHQGSSRVLARWYEIDPRGWPNSGNTPVLIQSGDIDLGSGRHTSFASVAVDDARNAAVAYARSSTTEFFSSAYSTRKYTDAAGTMPVSGISQQSNSPENSGRWGDYSGCEADPSYPGLFWSHHEWCESGAWRTWVQPFYATKDLWGTSLDTIRGQILGGALKDTIIEDGNVLTHRSFLRSSSTDPYINYEIRTRTFFRNQVSASVKLVYRVDALGFKVRTQLLNHNTGVWETVDFRDASTTNATIDAAVATPANYIRSSDGRVFGRVLIEAGTGPLGQSTVRLFTDRWAWIEN